MRFMTIIKGPEDGAQPPQALKRGKLHVTDGPFTEAKEMIGGYAIIEVASKAEAIEHTKHFMALHIKHWPDWEGECEVRQLEAQ